MKHDHPPGMIAVPCLEHARFHAFTSSLVKLVRPRGTQVTLNQGISIPENLNTAIREMMKDPDLAWLFMLGDDQAFDPDALIRLLDRELDVVVPVIPRRRPPFGTVLYDMTGVPIRYGALNRTGVQRVWAAGTGGMLVRRHVLEDIGDPWFSHGATEASTEDVEFCLRVQQTGYEIHVDTEVRMGHCAMPIVWPTVIDGSWKIVTQYGPKGSDIILVEAT